MLARIISATCCSMGLADVAVWVSLPGRFEDDAVVADNHLVAFGHGVVERHGEAVVVIEAAFELDLVLHAAHLFVLREVALDSPVLAAGFGEPLFERRGSPARPSAPTGAGAGMKRSDAIFMVSRF